MNKALLDTDILSEIIKGFDQTVARNAATYDVASSRCRPRRIPAFARASPGAPILVL